MVDYGCKMEEKVKAVQSEIKKNIQGTKREGMEAGIQINDLEQREEINIHLGQKEETRIQKNEENIRRLWDISKSATSES